MLPSNAPDWDATGPSPPPRRRGPRLGGLLVTVALLVALIAVIVVAVNRLPTVAAPPAASPRGPAATAIPTVAGAPADPATAAAIQDVIRRVNEAQTQAIATNNPQVMAATATPEFYAQQVATNRDLAANGVTEVALLNMEWGPIAVAGDQATATVWETWSTGFDDGSTDQSRDRNVYTLVRDQSGAWKVRADEHPDADSAPLR